MSDKKSEDWKRALEKYRDSLNEMVENLQRSIGDEKPSKAALDALHRSVGVVNRAGRAFEDDVIKAYQLIPSPYDSH